MISAIWLVRFAKLTFLWNPGHRCMPTVRTAKHLLLESTTKSVDSGTYDVVCQFWTVKGMVVESEVLKAQSCALSKLSLPVHSNEARYVCEKLAITGHEPVSQDRSSKQSRAVTIGPKAYLFSRIYRRITNNAVVILSPSIWSWCHTAPSRTHTTEDSSHIYNGYQCNNPSATCLCICIAIAIAF